MKIIRKLSFLAFLTVTSAHFVSAQVDLENGLSAYYKMEGDMTDASGNGYDGTYYASGINNYQIADRFGAFNTRRFSKGSDGSNATAALTSADAAIRSSSFTISFWYQIVDGFDDDSGVLDLGTMINAGTLYTIAVDNEGLKFTTVDASATSTTLTTNSGIVGVYHMATLTYDGTTLSAYLNGELKQQEPVNQPALGSGAITVGYPFEGAIDDIRIYSRSISSEEVEALYGEVLFPDFSVDNNSGTGSLDVVFSTSTSSSDAGITDYEWNFGDGATSNLANPTHTYSQPGTYHVSLKLTDANNRSRELTRRSLISVASETITDVQLQYAEYYFDTDPGVGNGTSISFTEANSLDLVESIDLSSLSTGFHQLMVRTQDDLGRWSSYYSRTFYIMEVREDSEDTTGTISDVEYFFDTDPGAGNGTSITLSAADSLDLVEYIDVSSLTSGFHQLILRVKDNQGVWGHPFSRTLYIMPQTSTVGTSELIVGAEYFIGDDPGIGQATALDLSTTGASIEEQLEVAIGDLVEGDYSLVIRVKDDLGRWSIAERRAFSVTNGPISSDNTLEVKEDSVLTFTDADFNYTSANGTTFSRVQINSLPTNGELLLNGQAVTISQEIAVSAIELLEYSSQADFAGTDSFDFTVGDADALSVGSSTMTIEITSVNDAPSFTLSGDINVQEDFTTTETVTVTTEPIPANELDQTVTYSIDPNSVTFAQVAIDAATGTITITSVAGGSGNQEFTVTADDGQEENNTSTSNFTLTVNPLNQTPQIANQTFGLDENSPVGTSVGNVEATDNENETIAFAILSGNDLGAFQIDASTGELRVLDASVLDYETVTSFELEVSASDGNSNGTGLITINLENVNEAPEITSETFTVVENAEVGTSLGTISASDPENDALTWSIVSGNTDDAFSISIDGELTVNTADVLDFETQPELILTVEVSDGSIVTSVEFTISVTDDGNQVPTLSNQSITIDENLTEGTLIGELMATDPENDVLEYFIISGNTGEAFSLSTAGELVIASVAAIDFETNPEFELTVEVSDGDQSSQAVITVVLNDLDENEAPEIDDQIFSIDENSESGTVVGIITASDPDGDALTFEIDSDNNTDQFHIDAESGQVIVSDGAILDFESTASYTLVINVYDGALTTQGNLSINVQDVNEAPTMIEANFTIEENSPNGTLVGVLEVSDPESDELSIVIIDGDASGVFAIANDVELIVADEVLLDFENQSSFTLTLEVSDGNLTSTAVITVELINIEEPMVLSDSYDFDLVIYPNPTQGMLHIKGVEIKQVKVFDSGGRLVFSGTSPSIDLTALDGGVYLIELFEESGRLSRHRIVVN